METIRTIIKPIIDLPATGNQIKTLRRASGLSVRDLQDVFCFDYPQAIYAWEQGRNVPTVDNLLVLARLFNCTIDEIVKYRDVESQVMCSKSA